MAPRNTTATICVPTRNPPAVLESGRPAAAAAGVRFLRFERGAAVYEVGSGQYRFHSNTGKKGEEKKEGEGEKKAEEKK